MRLRLLRRHGPIPAGTIVRGRHWRWTTRAPGPVRIRFGGRTYRVPRAHLRPVRLSQYLPPFGML